MVGPPVHNYLLRAIAPDPTFHSFPSPSKATVFRLHLKTTPAYCIYPYTGMKTRPSTPMIPQEAIRPREKVGDLACVYLSAPTFPLVSFWFFQNVLECNVALVSYNPLSS